MQNSAGCRYSAGISLYSAHTGTVDGLLCVTVHVCTAGPRIRDEWALLDVHTQQT